MKRDVVTGPRATVRLRSQASMRAPMQTPARISHPPDKTNESDGMARAGIGSPRAAERKIQIGDYWSLGSGLRSDFGRGFGSGLLDAGFFASEPVDWPCAPACP